MLFGPFKGEHSPFPGLAGGERSTGVHQVGSEEDHLVECECVGSDSPPSCTMPCARREPFCHVHNVASFIEKISMSGSYGDTNDWALCAHPIEDEAGPGSLQSAAQLTVIR